MPARGRWFCSHQGREAAHGSRQQGAAGSAASLPSECKRSGDDDLVFTVRHVKPGEPLTPNAVPAWFRDLYTRRLRLTGYSSHSGRHTFATQAARKATLVGASLRDVQDRLGHASLQTTQRYLEPSSDAKRLWIWSRRCSVRSLRGSAPGSAS
jgi:integrase